MEAFIDMPNERRRLLCEEAGQRLGLAATSVEKDFWICWALRELFALTLWGEQLSFKGGTSLSKGWGLIQRFSEDIDVVISREFFGFDGETLSNNQRKKLIKTCSERIHHELLPALHDHIHQRIPSDQKWSLSPASKEEDPDQQTLIFEYPRSIENANAYSLPLVKIEMGARSATEPCESPAMQPYLCEVFSRILGPGQFAVRTIAARRTFWDKVMLLHEETYRPPEKSAPKARMARHYYDVWCMIGKGIADQAMGDTGLFERVAEHRQNFFGHSWVDYETLRPGSLRLLPREDQLSTWRTDYAAMRSEMFFGDVPKFDEILSVVADFAKRFNQVAA